MRFDILTLFPEFFTSPLKQSIIGKAMDAGLLDVRVHNIRDYTRDKHRSADDYPYGGGAGMVLKPEPVVRALEAVKGAVKGGTEDEEGGAESPLVVLTTPQGEVFNQATATELAKRGRTVIICGRYEGVDERIRSFVDMELSVGDYILTGGEIPALTIVDAVGRLIPGVLGARESAEDESFTRGLLEYPQYTRPVEFRGLKVPEVLLSGNHGEIERWRRLEALKRTLRRRPDLLEQAALTEEEREILSDLKSGSENGHKL